MNYAKVLTMTNDADRADAKRGGTPWFSISVLLSKDHSTTGRISRNQIRKIGTSVFGSLKLSPVYMFYLKRWIGQIDILRARNGVR